MNPYLKRLAAQGSNAHGKLSERKLAKKIGARLTPNSGAMKGAKGDMTLPEFLLEAKATDKHSLSVELAWLVKIATEALNARKAPGVTVSFVTGDGSPRPGGTWVMIPLPVFQELTQ